MVKTKAATKLEPCPKCGKPATVHKQWTGSPLGWVHRAGCKKCKIGGRVVSLPEVAAKLWNRDVLKGKWK